MSAIAVESPVAALAEFAEPRAEPLSADGGYARPVHGDRIERLARALEGRGFRVVIAANGAAARDAVLERLPKGAEVFDFTSKTLEALDLTSNALAAKGYRVVRPAMMKALQSGNMSEARRLAAAPDHALGSVHAVTEQGQLVIASASGSQLPAYASGAGHVIWVVGTQKVVPNLEEALRRIERYSYPLEDVRARAAYGVASSVAKVLIINREATPDRATVVLVPESLGY